MANEVAPIADDLKKMGDQFLAALPEHITVDRFSRICMTAINGNPDLVNADRRSLLKSCMEAAQDGLRPDGREGALVIFNTKVKDPETGKESWIKAVKWMPMVAGIIKKARNSGEIKTLFGRVVYAGDKYRYWVDDAGEHLEYEPCDDPDLSSIIKVFSMAILTDGTVNVEPMTPKQVEEVRKVSRAKDSGPWVNWWDQMAIKTAIRRLSKRLPMSPDLERVIQRDDDLHDFSEVRRASFERVENPLRDQPAIEHDADGVVAGEPEEVQPDDKGPAPRGANQLENDADVVILQSGEVKKFGGDIDAANLIIDFRFDETRFDDVAEWRVACRENGLSAEFDGVGNLVELPEPEPAGKTAQKADARAGTDQPATGQNAQASSQKGAKATPKAEEKPYTDDASYMTFMRKAFDGAKAESAITELWGSTRSDRNSLLSNAQIDELTKEKGAAVKTLRTKKGDI